MNGDYMFETPIVTAIAAVLVFKKISFDGNFTVYGT
jgi:hypothetical protein